MLFFLPSYCFIGNNVMLFFPFNQLIPGNGGNSFIRMQFQANDNILAGMSVIIDQLA